MIWQVSVITPVYNAESYIEKSVESAIMQKQVREVVLVEDGSKDGSLEVCKRLAEKFPGKVFLYQHEGGRNKGAGPSRNLGVSLAKSDYIAFLDADDFYLPNRFDVDEQIYLKDKSVDGVYSALGFHFYSEGAKQQYELKGMDVNGLTTVNNKVPPAELLDVLLGFSKLAGGYFSGDGLTLRKQAFDNIGGFQDLFIGEDTLLWYKLAFKFKLMPGVLDRAVAMRGCHESNRISNVDHNRYYSDRILLFKYLYSWLKDNKADSKYLLHCLINVRVFQVKLLDNSKVTADLFSNVFRNPSLLLNDRLFAEYAKRLNNNLVMKMANKTRNLVIKVIGNTSFLTKYGNIVKL